MENEQLVSQLAKKFSGKVEKLELNPPQAGVKVAADAIVEVAKFIKEDENFAIDYLSSITANDLLEDGMEMVYHFSSTKHHHKLTIKVPVNREKPEIATIMEVFPAANWFEREAWELFGIDITGHPNLKQLLLPDDWDQGYPMRRDWEGGEDFVKMPEF